MLNAIVSDGTLTAIQRDCAHAHATKMKSAHPSEIVQKLTLLREEHRDLDEAINRLTDEPWYDQLLLRRMKKPAEQSAGFFYT